MTRTFTQLLAFVLLIISLPACVKSTNEQLTITKGNLAATYTLESMIRSTPGLDDKDITNETFPACQLDDQMVLKSNFTASYIDGGVRCSSTTYSPGYWDLDGNIITIGVEEYLVTSLTRNKLVILQSTIVAGLQITVTFTYNRF